MLGAACRDGALSVSEVSSPQSVLAGTAPLTVGPLGNWPTLAPSGALVAISSLVGATSSLVGATGTGEGSVDHRGCLWSGRLSSWVPGLKFDGGGESAAGAFSALPVVSPFDPGQVRLRCGEVPLDVGRHEPLARGACPRRGSPRPNRFWEQTPPNGSWEPVQEGQLVGDQLVPEPGSSACTSRSRRWRSVRRRSPG